MLLLFSFLSALALAAFGSHWVIVGAAAVLVLRALGVWPVRRSNCRERAVLLAGQGRPLTLP